MKDNKVVDLPNQATRRLPPPVTDFWFAQVDTRLNRIERMIRRLEWHLWAVFCGLGAILILAILEFLSSRS